MRRVALATVAGVALLAFGVVVTAPAAGAPKPPSQGWSFNGIFGGFDRAALRRGLQVYREVCSSCHSMNLVYYRNLGRVDFSENEVKAIAAAEEITDGPDADGEMFERPGLPSDTFVAPFANENAARAANGGALPPDLSVITKARKGGADYVHALLTAYKEEPPEGFELLEGQYYNEYFPGHQIAMAPPLADEQVEYADGTKATVEQMSSDVVTFLAWAAEPTLEERKRLGIKVMLFLIVLTAMVYALKRRIWSDLH